MYTALLRRMLSERKAKIKQLLGEDGRVGDSFILVFNME